MGNPAIFGLNNSPQLTTCNSFTIFLPPQSPNHMRPRTILLLIVIAIALIGFQGYRCHRQYYAEYDGVQEEIVKIPGIKVLKVHGNEDLTLEDIYAYIEMENGDQFALWNIWKGSFYDDTYFSLYYTHNWRIHPGLKGNFLKIDSTSPIAAIRDLHIRNIPDFIQRFDTIKAIIDRQTP